MISKKSGKWQVLNKVFAGPTQFVPRLCLFQKKYLKKKQKQKGAITYKYYSILLNPTLNSHKETVMTNAVQWLTHTNPHYGGENIKT